MITHEQVLMPVSAPDGAPVIVAGDYLNKISGEKIERECRQYLDQGYKELVVDFSRIEVINSIGVSILLGVIDSAMGAGAKVVLSDVNEDTVELLDTLGVTQHVTLKK